MEALAETTWHTEAMGGAADMSQESRLLLNKKKKQQYPVQPVQEVRYTDVTQREASARAKLQRLGADSLLTSARAPPASRHANKGR